MRRTTFASGIAPVAFAIATSAALVAGTGTAQAEGLKYSIGLIAGVSSSPFETNKTTSGVLPDVEIEGEHFSFGLLSGLTYDILKSDTVKLSARLAPRFLSADPGDVPGLGDLRRDTAVEAGLAAGLTLGQVQFDLEALKDVSDTHDGAAVTATVGTMFQISDRFSLGAKVGATWMDKKLATYSYGVLPGEARAGLPAYEVKESVIPTISLETAYTLSDHTTFVGSLSADFLPNSVTNSPIVKEDTVVSAMIGLRYAF
jgi:MipA family protein